MLIFDHMASFFFLETCTQVRSPSVQILKYKVCFGPNMNYSPYQKFNTSHLILPLVFNCLFIQIKTIT